MNAERALVPISLMDLGRGLDQCLATWRVPKDHNAQAAMDGHLEALSDLPADLVALAFTRAIKTLRFFPVPAEIRELVASEFSARRHTLSRLKAAKGKAEHEQAMERRRHDNAPVKAAEVQEIGRRLRSVNEAFRDRSRTMRAAE